MLIHEFKMSAPGSLFRIQVVGTYVYRGSAQKNVPNSSNNTCKKGLKLRLRTSKFQKISDGGPPDLLHVVAES